jgi:hypothetical protein
MNAFDTLQAAAENAASFVETECALEIETLAVPGFDVMYFVFDRESETWLDSFPSREAAQAFIDAEILHS